MTIRVLVIADECPGGKVSIYLMRLPKNNACVFCCLELVARNQATLKDFFFYLVLFLGVGNGFVVGFMKGGAL